MVFSAGFVEALGGEASARARRTANMLCAKAPSAAGWRDSAAARVSMPELPFSNRFCSSRTSFQAA